MKPLPILERSYTTAALEIRAVDGAPSRKIGGTAIVYNKYSRNLGGYVEQIAPGAAAKSLADQLDVVARWNHEDQFLLGRTSAGTLTLEDAASGLEYVCETPETSYGNDLLVLCGRGDVKHSSFAFRVPPGGQTWSFTEQDFPLRTITQLQLIDVAPVNDPAYLDTTSGLRSLAAEKGMEYDEVRSFAAEGKLKELITRSATVIDLAPELGSETRTLTAEQRRLAIAERTLPILG